ncbi:MarR family winged helix-turn-helix transcriptional regulator [Aeromicrobium sp. CnD17-E]|uniref:MarR family winged helix-turn-helix transcriptional regulator n=1 Tax=Aeromicrobium sp. CnD17-E TaxID=2954487 RepID=UPI0020980FC5|nr:MarR family transcriptional regulator [Aeromicrobium sp. CnD17-E]MCO7239130.1 MarR family transcriptional regulator [Aeromicrobium sp. CnD17-E]
MHDTTSQDALGTLARGLSEEVGPLRRSILNASRARAGLPSLPDAQIEVLRRLHPDRWESPTALGRRLGLARPTVSNLVSAMEKSGLVTRRADDADARSVQVGLTDLAREQLRVYDDAAESLLVEILGDLDPAQRRTLDDALPVLAQVRAALDEGGRRHPAPTSGT